MHLNFPCTTDSFTSFCFASFLKPEDSFVSTLHIYQFCFYETALVKVIKAFYYKQSWSNQRCIEICNIMLAMLFFTFCCSLKMCKMCLNDVKGTHQDFLFTSPLIFKLHIYELVTVNANFDWSNSSNLFILFKRLVSYHLFCYLLILKLLIM